MTTTSATVFAMVSGSAQTVADASATPTVGKLSNVNKFYGNRHILDDISLEVRAKDALTRLSMRALLLDPWRRHGFGILLVTHDVDR